MEIPPVPEHYGAMLAALEDAAADCKAASQNAVCVFQKLGWILLILHLASTYNTILNIFFLVDPQKEVGRGYG